MTKKNTTTTPTLTRPPIVAILGHVDHGKTTLLDFIRTTHRAAKEAGGITQSIGAYVAEFAGKKLTFIDTPGHAAFSKMRSRGASVADLAVLVVAADDSVKPQTIESIKHLKDAGIPYVVAINKIDKPESNPDVVKGDLTKYEVFVEGYGGNVPFVLVSGKTGKGVDTLLETLLLLADLEELQFLPDSPLEAPIIEARLDGRKGIIVSAIVQVGTLHPGDSVATPSALGKIKAIYDDAGYPIPHALPGTPVQLLGFNSLPSVGEILTFGSILTKLPPVVSPVIDPLTLSTIPPNKLNVILKADTAGSLEAIRGSFPAEVNVLTASTGDFLESDVLLSATTGALLLGFSVKIGNSVKKLAETEKVIIRTYPIIYDLLAYVEKKVLHLLEPTIDEEVLGEAVVVKLFDIDGVTIAGSRVTSGQLETGKTVHVKKSDGTVKEARIKAMRIGKAEAKIVPAGSECGVYLYPQVDIREKDSIISYNKSKETDL